MNAIKNLVEREVLDGYFETSCKSDENNDPFEDVSRVFLEAVRLGLGEEKHKDDKLDDISEFRKSGGGGLFACITG